MFAKQAPIVRWTAVAALALAASAGTVAQAAERQPSFDTEAALKLPAARSAQGLTRAQVRAEFIAARQRGEVSGFDTEIALRDRAPAAEPQPVVAQAGK